MFSLKRIMIGLTAALGLASAAPATASAAPAVDTTYVAPGFVFILNGQYYQSPNRYTTFRLNLNAVGNQLAVLHSGVVGIRWSTENWNPNGYGVWQHDGNLVLYSSDNKPLWASGTICLRDSCGLAIQDDGNVVIYNANHRPLWATGTNN